MSNRVRDSEIPPRPRPMGGAPGLVYTLAAVLLTAALALLVVRHFGGPMIYPLDGGTYGFASFYFSQNVTWLPFPRLAFETDWSVYPYGVNHAFLHWAFEREIFTAWLTALFGPGPWFQVYFLLSTLTAALGTFFILRREVGDLRAAFVGIAVSFCNYYAIMKFVIHIPYACVHWLTLGIVVDYVLVRRQWRREPWSARLVAARVALLFLGLGLEPGYVAGFSLVSFSVTVAWILLSALVRWRWRLLEGAAAAARELWHTARRHRTQVAVLGAIALLAAWTFVPLCFQLVRSSRPFDFPRAGVVSRWESPYRLLLPIVPGFESMQATFEDRGENYGFHFSPGLSFVVLALLGLALGRRRLAVVVPYLVFFLLCLAFRPELPTLKVFPWFQFARTAGHATCIFPVLLMIFFLNLPRWRELPKWARATAAAAGALFVVELVVAYGLITDWRTNFQYFQPDAAFQEVMAQIRTAPGEAVLEWPFVIFPSKGDFDVFFGRLGGTSQIAQFHHKKSVGAYFGRMPPDGLSEIRASGFQYLFLPEDVPMKSRRQRRDFMPEEWDFLERFVQYNSFAGVLLYTDFLPAATVAGFYERFGPPTASASFYPQAGKIEFIPKKEAWRRLEDPGKAAALELRR